MTGGERGFALIGFVVVALGAGLLLAIAAVREGAERETRTQTAVMTDLEVIADALVAFAAVNDRLPCPDGDIDGEDDGFAGGTCDEPGGVVPWRTLGLAEEEALDRWGRYVFYRVEPTLADPAERISETFEDASATGLTVCTVDEDTCNDAAEQRVGPAGATDRPGGAFVLISPGASGLGGFTSADQLDDPANEREQSNAGDSDPFYDLPITLRGAAGEPLDPTAAGTAYFDDVVYAMSVQTLMERAGLLAGSVPTLLNDPDKFITTENEGNHTQPQFKTAPHPDWAKSEEVLFFGGGDDDPDTYDPAPSDADRTACAWYEDSFDLTTQTLRGFLRLQFIPGEPNPDNVVGTSQGAALIFLPGEREVDKDTCGDPASNNSFGFKGPDRPKFALEFDIYRDNYEHEDDTSSDRSNPSPEGNHVAILNPDSQDYIGHGTTGNPECAVPVLNGDPGACTYPPGDEDLRPERHKATRPANWLEDAPQFDAALNTFAAQPYAARFEIRRRCDDTCSACGLEDEGGEAPPNIHFKAWIACDPIGGGTCPDVPAKTSSLTESLDQTTDYMVNACIPDRSLDYAESFDSVRVGIGFSSRDSATALVVHRFEVLAGD